jgi:FixJ family two-component response regulator
MTTLVCEPRSPVSSRQPDSMWPCSRRRPSFLRRLSRTPQPASYSISSYRTSNGLELQKELADRQAPPIVFITGHADVPSSVKAMKAGAVEFLPKPFGDEELLRAIDTALVLDRAERLKRSERAALEDRYERLTPREREVLTFVVAGLANKVTAGELGTSEITIGVHRGQIMRKMIARSLAELVRFADKLGIPPHENPKTYS